MISHSFDVYQLRIFSKHFDFHKILFVLIKTQLFPRKGSSRWSFFISNYGRNRDLFQKLWSFRNNFTVVRRSCRYYRFRMAAPGLVRDFGRRTPRFLSDLSLIQGLTTCGQEPGTSSWLSGQNQEPVPKIWASSGLELRCKISSSGCLGQGNVKDGSLLERQLLSFPCDVISWWIEANLEEFQLYRSQGGCKDVF